MKYLKIEDIDVFYNMEGMRMAKVRVINRGIYACSAMIGTANVVNGKIERWYDYELTNIYPFSEYIAKLFAPEGSCAIAARCCDEHCNKKIIDDVKFVVEKTKIPIKTIATFVLGAVAGYLAKRR